LSGPVETPSYLFASAAHNGFDLTCSIFNYYNGSFGLQYAIGIFFTFREELGILEDFLNDALHFRIYSSYYSESAVKQLNLSLFLAKSKFFLECVYDITDNHVRKVCGFYFPLNFCKFYFLFYSLIMFFLRNIALCQHFSKDKLFFSHGLIKIQVR